VTTSSELCPACGALTNPHCPDTNLICRWRKCARVSCSAVLDLGRKRGFIMVGSTATQVRWPS
jgi:hypothetical protein